MLNDAVTPGSNNNDAGDNDTNTNKCYCYPHSFLLLLFMDCSRACSDSMSRSLTFDEIVHVV